MKLSTFTILFAFLFGLATTSATTSIVETNTEEPDRSASQLVEDDRGILWVERGADNINPRVFAEHLSLQVPYFVVYVSTTDQYEKQAIQHALNLAKWFEDHPEAPAKVPVVAYRSDKKTHYYFEISGVPYTHPELAPEGIMGPQEALKLREDAVLTYRARMALREEGEFDFLSVKEVPILRNRD